MLGSPVVCTGLALPIMLPLPSWPSPFQPQAHTCPLASSRLWKSPEESWLMLVGVPVTRIGVAMLLRPHSQTWLLASRARNWWLPSATSVAAPMPPTCVGAVGQLYPQAHTVPSAL